MRTDTGLASRHPAIAVGPRRRDRVLLAVGIAVAAVSAGLYAVALATHPAVSMLKGFDLHVYLMGGELARNKPAQLYAWQLQPGIQFTYTPFAAVLFALIISVRFHVLLDVLAAVSLASLTVTVWIAFRELGWRGMARTGATLLVTGVALWLEPVQRTLFLGQIELMLMALIVWDLCQPDRRWWKGAGTGIAAGIKLVPLFFIAYLLVTRRFRQAAVATAAFVVTVLAGFTVLPHASRQWWLHGYFLQASRTGFIGTMLNQSERGLITRLIGSVASAGPLWLAIAIVTAIVGLAAAALLDRAGYTFAGLMVCALTALLVSPISWDHHWVWVAPGLAVLVDAAFRARSRWACAAWAAAAAAVVVTFGAWPRLWPGGDTGLLQGGLIWYAPLSAFSSGDNPHYIEYHWRGLQEIVGNLYVIVGFALFVLALAAAAYALRTSRASQRQRSGTPQRSRT